MLAKKLLGSLILGLVIFIAPINHTTFAQEESDQQFFDETADGQITPEEQSEGSLDSSFFVGQEYYRARVLEVEETPIELPDGTVNRTYQAKAEILGGDRSGAEIDLDFGGSTLFQEGFVPKQGTTVVVSLVETEGGDEIFGMVEIYRLNGMMLSVGVFLLVVILIARKRGIGSIGGLALSLLTIGFILIPGIAAGYPPLLITLLSIAILSFVSMYLSHGFNRRTTLAIFGIIGSVLISYLSSLVFVRLSQVYGFGSEESLYLQLGGEFEINLLQIFLSSVLIGMVGVLDDVTIAQAQALYELKFAKPNMTFTRLYGAGMRIGKEHIASLVNTLALAYVGTSLPFFILYAINSQERPLWVILNSEYIAEEVVRTLSGSLAIVLAVPITNIIIAWYLGRHIVTQKEMERLAGGGHVHSHNHVHQDEHEEEFHREKRTKK
jgi:uncharacterized membrane protein